MKLEMFIIKHSPEYADELVFLPVCSGCEQPITNFEEANLCPIDKESEPDPDRTVKVGKLDGAEFIHWPGKFGAYHWTCEPEPHTYPWKRLSDVFKYDQRGLFERIA